MEWGQPEEMREREERKARTRDVKGKVSKEGGRETKKGDSKEREEDKW